MFKDTALIITALVLGALAFAPINLYVLSFFYIAPFFIFLIQNNKLKKVLIGTFLFSFLFLTLTAYVTFEPLIFIVSSFIFLGLPISFHIIQKMAGNKIAIILLPVLWTIWDLIRALYSPLPFTVLTAGNTLGNTSFVGMASFGGLTTLTLFVAIVNIFVALLILKIKERDYKEGVYISSAIILITLSSFIISKIALQNNGNTYPQLHNYLNIAAISINAKFDSDFEIFENDNLTDSEKELAQKMIQKTIEPIKKDLEKKDLDLIILPEDMIDITITNDSDHEALLKYQITNAGFLINTYKELAKELNTNILTIMTTVKNQNRRISSILINENGEISGVYNKSTLTIGSEYWPFKNWRPFYYNWIGKIVPDIKEDSPIFDQKYSYEKGDVKILENNNIPKIGSPICVEIFYLGKLKEFKNLGAKIIIHSSSNIWTVDYGLKSYLKLSDKLRSIESVWLNAPIIFNGRSESAGIATPDGKIKSAFYETSEKNYEIIFETIKY
jgi:apolipoprotein N-acyltransferase